MTLSKLSLRNAKRQARDYLVYSVTIVIVAALLYAFNGLIFSQEIQSLSRRMRELPVMIVLSSIVVVCIISWLVSYTTNFMLLRRSRELGTYILIGLENKQVAQLFFRENLVVGGGALLPGILLGSLLFQVLRAILFALFGIPYHFSFFFSPRAVGLTLLYFVFIYLFAQLKSRKRIRRMKICDLIYYDRQNEGEVIHAGRKRRRVFAMSLVLGAAGTFLLLMRNLLFGTIGAGCIIAFLYSFFLSFASGVPAFFDRHPARKYQGQNLLIFRTLTAKLATMGIVMATISLLFTATIISEGTGLVFRSIFQNRARQNSCFDILLSTEDAGSEAFTAVLEYMNANIPAKKSHLYNVYLAGDDSVTDYVQANTDYFRIYEYDPVMRESDYAALRSMLGYPPAALEPGQYLIHCQPYIAKALKNCTQEIVLGEQTLAPGAIHTELFAQSLYDANGNGFILVVPDETVSVSPVSHTMYVSLTEEPVSEAQQDAFNDRLREIYEYEGYDNMFFYIRSAEMTEAAFWTALLVFPLYYLALALAMTAATILTIQQLGETNRYRRQFQLLQKLGMHPQEMAKALGIQSAIYYAMPAIPPVLISVPFLFHLAGIVEPGVMEGASSPLAVTGISLGLFFLIYAVYILLAYASLKRNVLPEKNK